jgi:hypothetical protein
MNSFMSTQTEVVSTGHVRLEMTEHEARTFLDVLQYTLSFYNRDQPDASSEWARDAKASLEEAVRAIQPAVTAISKELRGNDE